MEINLSIDVNNRKFSRPYITNVIQCWPGRVGNSKWDKPPKLTQLHNCKKWWQKELEIIQPEIIVFLGAETIKSFGKAIGNQWIFKNKLQSQGEDITIGEMSLKAFFLPHPAAPYPKKTQLYQKVFHQVRDILDP